MCTCFWCLLYILYTQSPHLYILQKKEGRRERKRKSPERVSFISYFFGFTMCVFPPFVFTSCAWCDEVDAQTDTFQSTFFFLFLLPTYLLPSFESELIQPVADVVFCPNVFCFFFIHVVLLENHCEINKLVSRRLVYELPPYQRDACLGHIVNLFRRNLLNRISSFFFMVLLKRIYSYFLQCSITIFFQYTYRYIIFFTCERKSSLWFVSEKFCCPKITIPRARTCPSKMYPLSLYIYWFPSRFIFYIISFKKQTKVLFFPRTYKNKSWIYIYTLSTCIMQRQIEDARER